MAPPRSLSLSNFRPEVHGHRGCRGLWPENTLPGFLHALALGVDAVEMDVVISADQQVVVSHEPWMSAAICRRPDGRPISVAAERTHNLYQLPYATIRQYDCGLSRHPRFPAQHSVPARKPLLREVLAAVEAKALRLGRPAPRYSIELKSDPAADEVYQPVPSRFLELVTGVVAEAGLGPRTTLLSFDKRILQAARDQAPEFSLCLLVEDGRPLAEHLRELGFMPAVYGPEHPLVDAELVAEARRRHLRLVPWTVNEPADMRRLVVLGVDGITTDFPNQLLALLA